MKQDGVTVGVSFEGGGPRAFRVPGHDIRLGQVIDNLIDNARSFSPPDGTVRITCRRLRNEVEIIVDDDGPGVRPEALEKIFERFYTDRPHQGFGQNSGLGLSISKQIVEAHGGRMWVENRLGIPTADGTPKVLGARFIVRLPARCNGRRRPSTLRRCSSARALSDPRPAGAGKSSLALRLVQAGETRLLPFARLVADDRAHVEACHGRLLVRPAPALAGLDRNPRAGHPPPPLRAGRGGRRWSSIWGSKTVDRLPAAGGSARRPSRVSPCRDSRSHRASDPLPRILALAHTAAAA